MPVWDDVIPEADRRSLAAAEYGKRVGFGEAPAILVIDVNYRFVGERPAPLLEAVRLWPKACGEKGWAALPATRALIEAGRRRGVPIIYTTGRRDRNRGRQGEKSRQSGDGPLTLNDLAIVAEVAPEPGDLVIDKPRASAPWRGSPVLRRTDAVLPHIPSRNSRSAPLRLAPRTEEGRVFV